MQTRFWHDCWLGDCALKVTFPNLFHIAVRQDLEVVEAWVEGQWFLEFRRQLNGILWEEWSNLMLLLDEVSLSDGRDEVFWALERSQQYSAKSLYNLMTFGGVQDVQMMLIWKCNIPLKVKIFLWMAIHDRIQCGVQLKKKKWSGPEECFSCDRLETSDHILFQCPIAVFLWSFFRECLGWLLSPTSCSALFLEILTKLRGKKQQVTLFLCAGALWTIWKARNDVVFNKKTMTSPVAIIYKTLMVVKSWRPLLKPNLKPVANEMINLVASNATVAM